MRSSGATVPTYGAYVSKSYWSILLLFKATGDPAYTTLGKLADAYIKAKVTAPDDEQSKAKSEYDAYATSLRRELVWQVS